MSSFSTLPKTESSERGPVASADFWVERKLAVAPNNGTAEKEAKSVADRVMLNQKGPVIQNQINRQPLSISLSPAVTPAGDFKGISDTSHAGLDRKTRSFMESRFNRDFSSVTIHTDSVSAQNAERLNAKAFTIGNDIYFNKGYYNPGSSAGKQLLAHELTHTIQQQGLPMQIQKQDKEEDETYAPKPEIDFEILPPEFQLKIFHFLLKADTGKLNLDYQTRDFMAGLSYQYGDALSLNMRFHDFKTKLGWTPGDNKFSLGLNKDAFSVGFTASPWQSRYGLNLTYGLQLPSQQQMGETFMAGGTSVGRMGMDFPGSMNDPIAYYQQHKEDVENISKTAKMIKDITKAGESKIKFGAGISITYDPTSQLVIGGKFGVLF